jgi:hypothetical protein
LFSVLAAIEVDIQVVVAVDLIQIIEEEAVVVIEAVVVAEVDSVIIIEEVMADQDQT